MVQNGDVKIKIGRGVQYRNLPQEAIEKIAEDLTFDNPTYTQAKKHGKFISSETPPFLYFFARSLNKKVFWTPRGYIWFMKKWLKNNNYNVEIEDKTILFPKIDIEFNGKLRSYQEQGVDEIIRRYPVGVLEAATGAGKTVMATAIIARRKQKTLIIVHNKELLYQWQGAISKFLDYNCGLVGDGKYDVKDITVGIINTVRNRIEELSTKFGHIVVDECHRCPSTTWTDILSEFPSRHYLGLSATPYRKDGLGHAIYAHIGPKLHTVDKEELHDSGAVLKPQIILVKTPYKYGRGFYEEMQANYSTIISDLTKNDARNKLIASTIRDDLKQNNENVLVVSDRKSHCIEIQNKIQSKSHVLTGSTPAKERLRIVEDIKMGRCNILIATISLIGEGFDAPNLSALFLTTPIKFSGRLIQVVGRILRPEENKIPRVYDFRDEDVRVLRYSGYTRNKIYKKQWG